MRRFRLAMVLVLACCCMGGGLHAADPVSFLEARDVPTQEEDRLVRAWAEYGLSNWDLATRLFRQVVRDRESTPAARLQAEFGLAYIEQYKMPGFNPDAAFPMYERLLVSTEPGTADHGVILRQMAECLLDRRTPDYEQARTHLQNILKMPAVPTLTRAAAAMDLARSHILEGMTFKEDEKKDESLLKAYAVLLHYRPLLADTDYLPVSRQLTAEIAMQLGDYPRAVEDLRTWLESGIRSIRLRATTIFRIARISEVELEDLETAALYYQRLADEVPSDNRAFWVKERVQEIAEGKDNHFARTPLTRIPQRDITADLDAMVRTLFGEDATLPSAQGDAGEGSAAEGGEPTDEPASEDVAR